LTPYLLQLARRQAADDDAAEPDHHRCCERTTVRHLADARFDANELSGTYAGNTNVRIDLMTDGLTASP